MTTAAQRKQASAVVHEGMNIGGEKVMRDRVIEVCNPFTEKSSRPCRKRQSKTSGARDENLIGAVP